MATITWQGGKHGLWSTRAARSGHQEPQSTDGVIIGAGNTGTINVAAAAADVALDGGLLVVNDSLTLGGTVANGTIRNAGGTFNFGDGATRPARTQAVVDGRSRRRIRGFSEGSADLADMSAQDRNVTRGAK
jgi:hypothetical protein